MRSRAAASILEGAGFERALNMEGGMKAWHGLVAGGAPEAGFSFFPEGTDILELAGLAWKLEDGSRRYYDGLVKEVSDPEAAKVLGSLVIAEDRHKSSLEELALRVAGEKAIPSPVHGWAESAGDFMEGGMRVQDALSWSRGRELPELLELTIALESNAYDLYLKMAGRVSGEREKGLFLHLSQEEKEHLERLTALFERKI